MYFSKRLVQLLLFLGLFIVSANAKSEGIEVTGTAKVSVVPDMATFSFAINGRGRILSDVKTEVDGNTDALVKLVKNLGVETRKITSSEVTINPQYNYQTKTLTGFDVSRNIKVILNDLENYSALINGAVKAGITTIRNIKLDIQNREELEQKLLTSALNTAKQKAMILAKGADIKLGKVLSIREAGTPIETKAYQFRESVSAAPMAQGVFEPGEISVRTSLFVKYSIE